MSVDIQRGNIQVQVTDDAYITLFATGNIKIKPFEGNKAAYLGVYDLAALLCIACGDITKVRQVIAEVENNGHRFKDAPSLLLIDDEEPF